jgi:hypothetical protein
MILIAASCPSNKLAAVTILILETSDGVIYIALIRKKRGEKHEPDQDLAKLTKNE